MSGLRNIAPDIEAQKKCSAIRVIMRMAMLKTHLCLRRV
jgi:hypothetical protein